MADSSTASKELPILIEKSSPSSLGQTSTAEKCLISIPTSIISKSTQKSLVPQTAPPSLTHKDSSAWSNASKKKSMLSSLTHLQSPNAEVKTIAVLQPAPVQHSNLSTSIQNQELKVKANDPTPPSLPVRTLATSISTAYLTISNALAKSPKVYPSPYLVLPSPRPSSSSSNLNQGRQRAVCSDKNLKIQSIVSPLSVYGSVSSLNLQKNVQNYWPQVRSIIPVRAPPQNSKKARQAPHCRAKLIIRPSMSKSKPSMPLSPKVPDALCSVPMVVTVSKPIHSLSSSTVSVARESLVYLSSSCGSSSEIRKTGSATNHLENSSEASEGKIVSRPTHSKNSSLASEGRIISGPTHSVVSSIVPEGRTISPIIKQKMTNVTCSYHQENQKNIHTIMKSTTQAGKETIFSTMQRLENISPLSQVNSKSQPISKPVTVMGNVPKNPAFVPVFSQPTTSSQGHVLLTYCPPKGQFVPTSDNARKQSESPFGKSKILDSNYRPNSNQTLETLLMSSQPENARLPFSSSKEQTPADTQPDTGNKASRIYFVNAMTGQGQVPVMVMAPDLDCDSESESPANSNLETLGTGHQCLTPEARHQYLTQTHNLQATADNEDTDSDIEMGDIEEQELSILSRMLNRQKTNFSEEFSPTGTSVSLTQNIGPSITECIGQNKSTYSLIGQNPISCSQQQSEEDNCLGLKIDSVFSLQTDAESEIDRSDTIQPDDKVIHVIIEKEEEPTTHVFNVQDSEDWKKAVTSCFVVLERLSKSDAHQGGQIKTQTKCSNYCRKRTLDYMCNLNLLPCDNHPYFSSTKQEMVQISQNAPRDELGKRKYPLETQCIKDTDQNVTPLPVYKDSRPTTAISPSVSSAIQRQASPVHSKAVSLLPINPQSLSTIEKSSDLKQFQEGLNILHRQVERKRKQMHNDKFSSKRGKMSEVTVENEKIHTLHKRAGSNQKLPISTSFLQHPKEKRKTSPQAVHVTAASRQAEKRKNHQISTTASKQIKRVDAALVNNARILSKLEKPLPMVKKTPPKKVAIPRLRHNVTGIPKSSGSTSLLTGTSFAKEGSIPAGKVQEALKSLAKYLAVTGRNVTQGNTQYFLLKIDGKHVLVKVPLGPSANFDLSSLASMEELKAAAKVGGSPSFTAMSRASTGVTETTEVVTRDSETRVQSVSKTAENCHGSKKPADASSKNVDKLNVVVSKPSTSICKSPGHRKPTASTPFAALGPAQPSQLKTTIQPQSQRSMALMRLQERKRAQAAQARQISQAEDTVTQMPCVTVAGVDKEKVYGDTRSLLSHVPPSSLLLPQRKVISTILTEEEKKLRRKKLESKYPLPPGVTIKSEPEDTGYETRLDNHSSDTQLSVASTGVTRSDFNSSSIMTAETREISGGGGQSATDLDDPDSNQDSTQDSVSDLIMSSYDYTTESLRESLQEGSCSNTFGEQMSESIEAEEIDFNFSDEPPPLIDESHISAKSKSVELDDNVEMVDERPPVLQPMFTSSSTLSWEESMEISDESSGEEKASDTNKTISSSSSFTSLQSRGSSQSKDSGYDMSIPSNSSSSSSLSAPASKMSLETVKASSSKSSSIQRLRELLKKKEMEIANIKKMRSELPQLDLDMV